MRSSSLRTSEFLVWLQLVGSSITLWNIDVTFVSNSTCSSEQLCPVWMSLIGHTTYPHWIPPGSPWTFFWHCASIDCMTAPWSWFTSKSKDKESKPFRIMHKDPAYPHLKPISRPWLHNPQYMFLYVTGRPFTSATSACGAVKQRLTNSVLVHVSGHVLMRRTQNRREFSIRKPTLQDDEDRTSCTMVLGF